MSDKKIWLLMKRYPGAESMCHAGYLDEESARYAAQKILSDRYTLHLETVPLGVSITEVLPGNSKTL